EEVAALRGKRIAEVLPASRAAGEELAAEEAPLGASAPPVPTAQEAPEAVETHASADDVDAVAGEEEA
ncbi:MAG: hypothetical protein RMM28_04810, partial [Thermoleophilia bacterium]|nr:hypothetical protein [Thermoleophilia bacterium]